MEKEGNSEGPADPVTLALNEFRVRAEAAASLAEEAKTKAHSEAGFAYNAKIAIEEHARAIAAVKGTVDADFSYLTSIKQKADEAANAAAVARTAAEADARLVAESKAAASNDANSVRGANERSAQQLAAIETIHSGVADALKTVTADAAAVNAAKATVEATVAPAQAAQTQISEILAKVNVDSASIAKNEADAKELIASLTEVAETAKAAQQRVTEYENKLLEQTSLYQELRSKIEGLLPGATSAGLASAFRAQRDRFKKSQGFWLIAFVATIVLLLAAGFYGLPISSQRTLPQAMKQTASQAVPQATQQTSPPSVQPETTNDSWEALLRHFVSRLPLVLPLIWFGIYAGGNYMLAIRGEEEYAFKEAVSTAFEGYKREMASIPNPPGNATPPIVSFCENVLQALTRRPGQIYEGPHDDMTPLGSVAKAVSDTAEALKAITEKIKP